ncbi:Marine sediment metagenome DNA, contig: S01H1_S24652 OS=marine sediment metagenome GN=S01H1_60202 PE=4 SV=1 [Gemmataceae bacterium]|nr:Marine sediment metagenome DNA, contig: S01H1_S24652 OS=marine sediment metagenome GN=S01H1_60202 PE=4 SV=1 [Gemmataceae bacterium]VTU00678.1 Marine sediment metagenome DNA, contig: S01H1_S24652 OS=marine sediment metagenome GN=S01H1_60202 PE=4 SV=1 [Gemmataceae bacterium]
MPRKPGYTSYSQALDGSEMSADELEFLLAVAAFQRRTGRRYPTWREVLHVAHCLGYRKIAEPTPIGEPHPFPDAEPGG